MHVGFSLLTLFPGRVGGSEANVRGLLGEFSQGNGPDRVTVLANRAVAERYPELIAGPVTLHRVRSYRSGSSTPTRLAAMVTAAIAPRAVACDVPGGLDVLHHPVTVPIPRVPGVPVVSTVYDVQHHDLPQLFSRAEREFRRWAYDRAARAADIVVTTSEYSRSRLVDVTGIAPAKVHVVRMGIDLQRFTPEPGEADEALRKRLPERYVVYPGNLWAHKNHDRLVQALGRCTDREVALVLSGQRYGKAEELMATAMRAGVADRVHHLGFLEPEEVPALLRGARAMVFPSLYEGFGSPPLEAMACGCPVASSRRASLNEVLGDAALELDPDDVDSIADAINLVISDEGLRSRLRTSGLRRAAQFTWSAAAARHSSIYENAWRATFDATARS